MRALFLDLENLAFLADSLGHLSLACSFAKPPIEFRSYCSPDFEWASRATHHSASNLKEAADVKMVVDASALAATGPPDTDILIITDDQFGRTLAAELPAVSWAAYDSALPSNWAAFLKARSLEKYFEAINVFRERRHRTPSVSGKSGVSCVSGVSTDSARSHVTRASWSRASWSRPASAVGEARRSRTGIPMPSPRPLERALLQGRRIGDASSAASQLNASKPRGPRKWPAGIEPSTGKIVGTIRSWNDKGFGFIRPLHPFSIDSRQDIFVHISDIHIAPTARVQRHQLHQLTRWDVEFKVTSSEKGRKACSVSGPGGQPLPADTGAANPKKNRTGSRNTRKHSHKF
jgi:cold shock CspA family protein